MASHTVPAGHVGVHEQQLAADTVDTVTFTGADLGEGEIITDGTAAIYVKFGDAEVPTVAGTDCWQIPEGAGSAVMNPRTSGDTVVNLISSGTPVYSVARTS